MLKIIRNISEASLEKIKIISQFVLMLAASVVLGVCISKAFSAQFMGAALSTILRHFSPHAENVILKDAFVRYVLFTLPDIITAIILLIFSFSFINYIVSDVVIVVYGVRLGIAASLVSAMQEVGMFDRVMFFVLRSVIPLLVLVLSYKLASSAVDIRIFSSSGRLISDKTKIIQMFLTTLAFVGLVLLLKGLYCLCLYI